MTGSEEHNMAVAAQPLVEGYSPSLLKDFERALARADEPEKIRGLLQKKFPFITDEYLDFLEKAGGLDKLRELYYQIIKYDLLNNVKTSHFIGEQTFQQLAVDQPQLFAAPEATVHTVRHRSSQTSSVETCLDICTDYLQNKGLGGEATLYDIGCGSGKIIMTAMNQDGRYADIFKRAVGIDYYQPVLDILYDNLRTAKMKLDLNKISLIFANAAEYNSFNGVNAVIAYNPFDEDIMKEVEKNLRYYAGKVIFGYIKPKWKEVFKIKGWDKVKEVDALDEDHQIAVYARNFV